MAITQYPKQSYQTNFSKPEMDMTCKSLKLFFSLKKRKGNYLEIETMKRLVISLANFHKSKIVNEVLRNNKKDVTNLCSIINQNVLN